MSGFSGIGNMTIDPPFGDPQKRIEHLVAELRKRGVASDKCARCNTSAWSVDFFQIPAVQENLVSVSIDGNLRGYLPVACFTCKNCGYIVYHNLRVLEQPK